jgi:hypothetical protein
MPSHDAAFGKDVPLEADKAVEGSNVAAVIAANTNALSVFLSIGFPFNG